MPCCFKSNPEVSSEVNVKARGRRICNQGALGHWIQPVQEPGLSILLKPKALRSRLTQPDLSREHKTFNYQQNSGDLNGQSSAQNTFGGMRNISHPTLLASHPVSVCDVAESPFSPTWEENIGLFSILRLGNVYHACLTPFYKVPLTLTHITPTDLQYPAFQISITGSSRWYWTAVGASITYCLWW